ncbi:peptide deformylase (plasmid) [Tistrella bauzanensis]|uniref:Peptide deformylase-like n=1 Tax=Tistrella arctica TaxID=3133430 RepID=A0ABU9YPL5_9PROT
MSLREIIKVPDPRLRMPCAAVERFDDALRQLTIDLVDTMRAAPGIGMTAAHVGILQRIVVIELEDDPVGVRAYVNPIIEWSSDDWVVHEEGSVSMPGVSDEVERPARIRLRWQDLDGAWETAEADGLLAVCLQHEIDQLDGIFWTQHLSKLRRDRLTKRYEKLQRLATRPKAVVADQPKA